MFEGGRLAVVVPAYNERALILDTLGSIPEYVDCFIVVDDCSSDKTSSLVSESARKDKRISLIKHELNRGVGAAIASGYKKSLELQADYVVVLAGDNQMDPKYLPSLLEPLVRGEADYVKGNRLIGSRARRGMPKFRLLGNALLSLLTKFCSGYWNIIDPQNGYAAVSRRVLETLDLDSIYPRYGYPNDLLIKLNVWGFRIKDVGIPAKYGLEESKIKYASFIPKVSLLLLMGFFWRLREKYVLQSFHPLVFFYLMGFVLTPLGVLSALYFFYLRYFVVGRITAATALIPMFLFIIGLQSLFFAMLFDMEANKD